MNCRILVCCHKKDIYADTPPFFPIQVGKGVSQIDLGIAGDDTGESISQKNSSYCELTGMYWAWKNLKNVDVIGLSHYRRYFDFYHQGRRGFPWTRFETSQMETMDLCIPDSILQEVSGGSVVVAKPEVYRYSLFNDYCVCHISDDIRVLHNIIRETQPKEIQDAFFRVIVQGNKLSHFNMFIMPWNLFDEYCSWLFPLLQSVEDSIDISHYNAVQKRIFGYMAERLQGVWLDAHRIPLIKKPVIWFKDSMDLLDLYSPARFKARLLVNDISHFISKPRQ